MSDFRDLSRLLEPRSIAVIGASDRPGNLGGDTVRRLLKFGFPGHVWPVNPSAQEVAGVTCFSSVSALPGVPDLAILAVPANVLIGSVAECASAGVRAGIAYAGGLADAGGEGAELQKSLANLCREAGFVLCGPNCVGNINATVPVTATFSTALFEMDRIRPGVISMVGQSGGICTGAFSMVQNAGFGFRHMVSSGNEAVVSFADYLYALALDPGTSVIAGYLEGIQDGARLVRALEEARKRNKPVVLIKAGTNSVSARAAMSHTGALVGEDRVFDAVFKEMGGIRVYSLEELVDVCLTLAGPPKTLPPRPGVGIVTFGGGNGVLAADQCAQSGLATPPLGKDCVERLRPLLVSVATAANPLDLTPTTAFRPESLARLPEALDVIAEEPGIHALLFIVGSMAAKRAEISDVIFGLVQRSSKPVFVCWPSPPKGAMEWFAERAIHAFVEPARAIRVISRMSSFAERRPPRPASMELPSFDWTRFVPGLNGVVSEHVCHRILCAAGLPVAEGELVNDETRAVEAGISLGLPVVMKGISTSVTHRAKTGLVVLDLSTEQEVRVAFKQIQARAREIEIELDGIYVQKMHKGGAELLVTAFRDPNFGTMLTCGSGGALAELLDDTVTERAPVNREIAVNMVERLRLRNYAVGAEGGLSADSVAAFIVRFSALAATAPWSRFVLEINPMKWTSAGVVAVDGLLIVGDQA